MSPRAAVRRLPDHDDRPATVRDVRRLIDDALLSLVGEQREREQRRIDQTLDQIVRAATSAVRESIVRTDAKRSLVPLFRLDEWLAARS